METELATAAELELELERVAEVREEEQLTETATSQRRSQRTGRQGEGVEELAVRKARNDSQYNGMR